MSDIYEAISNDHKVHRRLLKEISGTQGDFEHRRQLWRQFYYDVKSHAAAEEESFYAKLMETSEGQDDARHSVAEHKQMDDIMEELNDMEIDSPGWLNRFATLQHEYEHHMEEEEEDIFAQAREVFSKGDAEAFATRFLDRKKVERQLVDEKAEESLEE